MRSGPMIVAALAIAAAGPALAADADAPADPIAKSLNACLAKPENGSTAGMLDCIDRAHKAYDAELNSVYHKVMEALDDRSKALVRESERRWLAFRDAEHAAMKGPWAGDRGTIVSVDIGMAEIDAIRERIGELRLYLPDQPGR